MIKKYGFIFMLMLLTLPMSGSAQAKFQQLGPMLRTPNVYRNAAGAPGYQYYQMQADYKMDIHLDDKTQRIDGTETITYHNNSPEGLTYLWIQLDQNMRAQDSDSKKISTSTLNDEMSFSGLERITGNDFDGGFKIEQVKDAAGKDLHYVINKTMMRVDLPRTLAPNKTYSLKIKWWYNINDRMKVGGRSGYEHFEEDDNYLYTIAQFFPRMAVYNEVEGWQNKQFLGRGEFTLPFGDYVVNLTVPSDHIVGATGVLQNESKVLTAEQRSRFKASRTADEPVMIVNAEEALAKEATKATDEKTWTFKAENVRDFGFCTSRRFIWDAIGVKFGNRTVMAMSYYPKEGNPLWEQYSTKVVAHTLKSYSKFTFDYPYPVAISVHTDRIGMEYPMICFNGGRPDADGTYSERTKYGMIGVIIHEVGHNFFPMIVNSDERQWTWMDEGLNTFVQYLTEQEWDHNYPSRRGPVANIVPYMSGDQGYISPIMSNSESVFNLGSNAYAKPTTALNILRETVMGRELFDYSFKEYSRRWMFKHPTPDDFFRTMEDASAVDLDWFWRGWFYTVEACDLAITNVRWMQVNTQDPNVEKPIAGAIAASEKWNLGNERNHTDIPTPAVVADPKLNDFYNSYDEFKVTPADIEEYEEAMSRLSDKEKAALKAGKNFYEISFENVGGLIMPIILQFDYVDGTKEIRRIPAEIWRLRDDKVTKVFVTDKEVTQITLDPYRETADIETSNNYWPHKQEPTRFELFKRNFRGPKNPMQKAGKGKK